MVKMAKQGSEMHVYHCHEMIIINTEEKKKNPAYTHRQHCSFHNLTTIISKCRNKIEIRV